jgi:hypothetical protein
VVRCSAGHGSDHQPIQLDAGNSIPPIPPSEPRQNFHLSEIVVSDNGHRVFIIEDEYPTRGVCFSFTRFDIRTFTCFIRVSLVLGSVYILDRASIGMNGVLLGPRSECSFIPRSCSCAIFQHHSVNWTKFIERLRPD